MPLIDVPTVHAVTDAGILVSPGFLDRAREVLRTLGPAGAVHLRGPTLPGRTLWELADALAPIQRETGGWVIVNDRIDVALAADTKGGQLGQRSMSIGDARRVAPSLGLGASVHSAEEAEAAAGADWWIAGHVYETPSHTGEPGRGLDLIRSLAALGVPLVAIGGVKPAHVRSLRSAGAHGIAAISGIWGQPDPAKAALDYL